ncbi:MAG: hypothetical protein CL764_05845 [Chloroflexi bacterium]|nr:hypothetical protein [Chloroflexota bacterium]|tara:strand:- start:22771 stop:23724 length:954 start_codon:yes stop_codon:yes gene_type:complete
MKIFSVTSPKPGLGKTSLISGLSNILISQGKNVKILNSIFSDSALSYELFPDDVVVSGNFKKNGSIIDDSDRIKEINKVVNSFENQTEYCFVESNFDSLEYNNSLVETLNSESILVIDYSKDIKSRLKQYKEKLFGIIINNVPKFRMNKIQDDLLNSIRKDGFKVIGIIPEDRCLLSCTIEQLSEHINGKFIYKNYSTNSLIENILIGGMVLDWSVHYFSSSFNVAAVIRGDRPDLQLGALQSGKVKVLILTKAMEPIEYVSYEAEKLGIPIILSEKNTEETVNLFENIHSKSNFNHPEKLQRITDLISTNCNMQLF